MGVGRRPVAAVVGDGGRPVPGHDPAAGPAEHHGVARSSMEGRRVLVLGATGLLGPYLVAEARARGALVDGVGRRSGAVRHDLTASSDAMARLNLASYDVVVNAVALTDVDACEREPERARAVNAGVVAELVGGLARATHLVHVSTDQVYPDAPGPHREGVTGPVNAYGRSKLGGEIEACRHPRTTVVRTNFFGPSRTSGRASLSDWALGALARREPIDGFAGSWFSPLRLDTVARWCFDAVAAGATGTFNLGSRDGMSKYEFILALARAHRLDGSLVRAVEGGSRRGRARRAPDLRLDVGAIEARLEGQLPTLAEEVAR